MFLPHKFSLVPYKDHLHYVTSCKTAYSTSNTDTHNLACNLEYSLFLNH